MPKNVGLNIDLEAITIQLKSLPRRKYSFQDSRIVGLVVIVFRQRDSFKTNGAKSLM